MSKIAVILSGCGVMDGSEIHESVLTLLALDKHKAQVQCFAPNIEQMHVINHLTNEPSDENRNVLVESARIARGEVIDLAQIKVDDYDGAVFPGGFGAAKNLCSFAVDGADMTVNEDVSSFVTQMRNAGKPVAFICISPAMIPKLYPKGAQVTIGNDEDTAKKIEAMGAVHSACDVKSFVVDKNNKVVSTPAYMLAQSISEAAIGIEKTIEALLEMV